MDTLVFIIPQIHSVYGLNMTLLFCFMIGSIEVGSMVVGRNSTFLITMTACVF